MLGGYLGVVGKSSTVTVTGGSGSTSTETLFIAYSTSDPFGAGAIEPGGYATLRSCSTGQFCRLIAVSGGGGEGLVCDQANVGSGTALLYNTTSLTINGLSLVSDGSSLLLDQGGAAAAGCDCSLVYVPSRECPVPVAWGCISQQGALVGVGRHACIIELAAGEAGCPVTRGVGRRGRAAAAAAPAPCHRRLWRAP